MKYVLCRLNNGSYAAMPATSIPGDVSEVLDLFEVDSTDEVHTYLEKKATAELEEVLRSLSHFGGNALWEKAGMLAVKSQRILQLGNAAVYPPRAPEASLQTKD